MKLKENISRLKKKLNSFDFKVDDNVIILNEGVSSQGKIEGKFNNFYLVNINGKKGYYKNEQLKFKDNINNNKFKKGDKIKTIEGMSGYITKIDINNKEKIYWVNNQVALKEKELIRG